MDDLVIHLNFFRLEDTDLQLPKNIAVWYTSTICFKVWYNWNNIRKVSWATLLTLANMSLFVQKATKLYDINSNTIIQYKTMHKFTFISCKHLHFLSLIVNNEKNHTFLYQLATYGTVNQFHNKQLSHSKICYIQLHVQGSPLSILIENTCITCIYTHLCVNQSIIPIFSTQYTLNT